MIESISIYGAVALSRIGLQVATSRLELRRKVDAIPLPLASLIVPTYNEPMEVFIEAMKSLMAIDYPGLEIVIVDDGSTNAEHVRAVVEKCGFTYVYQNNAGKREAMYLGLSQIRPESQVVMFSDSDTIWQPDAARQLAYTLLADSKTGAVTGEVAVRNHSYNMMTRLIGMRYHIAFAYERASQSYFKTVTCVSGPLGAYRRDVIDGIKDAFVSQQFMGKKCTYGDDRHLTNLVLGAGYQVRYAAKAKCFTQAPTKFIGLLKQQTRWGKSYWRELIWQLKTLRKHGPYLSYDFAVTAFLPIILVGSLVHSIVQAVTGSAAHALSLVAMFTIVSLIRVADPMIRKRDLWYLSFVIYAVVYFVVLLPVKILALLTINTGKWGSREKVEVVA